MTLTLAAARRLWDDLSVPVDEGLAELELRHIEVAFGFAFSPDHRVLLQAGFPLGGRWPDWRDVNSESLRQRLGEPVAGVLFDVEENGFWWPAWGARPADRAGAITLARQAMEKVPRLVPVYGHRYAPALPEPGLPVLSVVQTDVVVYGSDIADYLAREFGSLGTRGIDDFKEVPFWTEIA